MKRVRGRSVILKWIQDRSIVQRCLPGDVGSVASTATCGAIAVDHRGIEPFVEETPGHTCCIQQVTNVPARHMDQSAALVAEQISLTGLAFLMSVYPPFPSETMLPCSVAIVYDAVGLTGDEIDGAQGRRSERSTEEAVAHRVMLRIVP